MLTEEHSGGRSSSAPRRAAFPMMCEDEAYLAAARLGCLLPYLLLSLSSPFLSVQVPSNTNITPGPAFGGKVTGACAREVRRA